MSAEKDLARATGLKLAQDLDETQAQLERVRVAEARAEAEADARLRQVGEPRVAREEVWLFSAAYRRDRETCARAQGCSQGGGQL